MLPRLGGPRRREFAIRVKGALAADGVDDDGRIPGRAEEIDGHVNLADVDEPADPQAVIREARGMLAFSVASPSTPVAR